MSIHFTNNSNTICIFSRTISSNMFGLKSKIENAIRPRGVYDNAKILRLMLKLTGFFPLKIEETASGSKAVFCKFGVFSTIIHLLLYLSSVIHFVFVSNEKVSSLNYGKIGDYGYVSILVLEGITTLVLFSSVFVLMNRENLVIKYTTQVDTICHQLKIDNTAIFIKSRFFMIIFIIFLVFFYILGAGIFIHTQFVSMRGVPPIDLIIIGILPHLYMQIKLTSFLIYILALHVSNIEFYNFLELYLKDV